MMIPVIIGLLIGLLLCPGAVSKAETDIDGEIATLSVTTIFCTETRTEWLATNDFGNMHITCYGPDRNGIGGFPLSSNVSRWFGRTRDDIDFTVEKSLEWAYELGLDGICAASPGPSGLYARHRDDILPIVEIEGHGRYLVIDRMDRSLWNRLDIWVPDPWLGGTYFSEPCNVQEIESVEYEVEVEYEVDNYGCF